MTLETSMAICALIFYFCGFFAYHSLNEKIERIQEDLRGIMKDVAKIEEETSGIWVGTRQPLREIYEAIQEVRDDKRN